MPAFKRKRIILVAALTAFACGLLNAETFRVAQCRKVELIEDTSYSVTKKAGLNDAIAVFLPEDRIFLEGIEFKLEIPEETAMWKDCCGVYIYDGIRPVPTEQQIDFSGSKLFFGVIPGKLSWVLQVPLTQGVQLKTNQYTKTIDKIPSAQGNFVFLRLQPLMKGVPDEVMNSKITFTIRPILSDKGLLKTAFTFPEESTGSENISIFIDNTPYMREDAQKGLLLETGIHNISVISENFRTEVRKVRIDQAKKTELLIELKSIEPTVIITAPEGAVVFLDEEEFTEMGKEYVLTEGEHKIKCGIGDYEIVRTLSVTKGRTYKVNLTVDLQIQEDE